MPARTEEFVGMLALATPGKPTKYHHIGDKGVWLGIGG